MSRPKDYNELMDGFSTPSDIKTWLILQAYVHAREKNSALPNLEGIIAQNGEVAYFYALRVLHGPFKKGENAISMMPSWAVKYARFIIKQRFLIAEKHIAGDPELCYEYFKHVIKKRLPKKMHQSMVLMSFDHPQNTFVRKYFNEVDSQKGERL